MVSADRGLTVTSHDMSGQSEPKWPFATHAVVKNIASAPDSFSAADDRNGGSEIA